MNDIYQEEGLWKIHCFEAAADEPDLDADKRLRSELTIGPATGPDRLTKREAQRAARNNNLTKHRQNEAPAHSRLTIASFIETAFVPEYVQAKRLAGRSYYHAILKHVLPPEEVDRIFHVCHETSKSRLKAVSGWPYLGDLLVQDCGPEHVERLISAAHARGYSAQTVEHIRNVVSAIFSFAIKLRHYHHGNPAKSAMLPKRPNRNPHLLTLAEAKEVLGAMRYPEREMTLIAMLTSMNVVEICGLQWKHVNLTGTWSRTTDEPIPPFTIAVRKRWYRGELEGVSAAHAKNRSIPELLLPILITLSGRGRWTGPDDFVLVSRVGTPINAINITARRLRTIGNELQMPWLTWSVFRRGHFALKAELGAHFHYLLASTFRPESPQGTLTQGPWSQPVQLMDTSTA